MIRELGESLSESVLRRVGRGSARVQERTPLPVDLLESDEGYLAVFDAPGATASDVQVRYADGRVFVRIERFRSFRDGFEMLVPGRGLSLDGDVELPDDAVVDPDAASATLTEHGTLEVEIPRRGDQSSTSVPVRDASEEAGADVDADEFVDGPVYDPGDESADDPGDGSADEPVGESGPADH